MKKLMTLCIFVLAICMLNAQTTPGEYEITKLNINSKNSDFGPAFLGSNKIIFASSRGGGAFQKKWEETNQPFLDLYEGTINEDGSITDVKNFSSNLDSKYHESSVAFSPDGRTAYFTRNNELDDSGGQSKEEVEKESEKRGRRAVKSHKELKEKATRTKYVAIYIADVDLKGNWFNIRPFPYNNRNYSTGHPTISRDGSKLYFTSDMPGAYGGLDIFVCDILPNGEYSKPKNLGRKVNTLGREMFPYIDKKNILYFSSDSRRGGMGGLDIYAIRIYDDAMSDALHLTAPINSKGDDFGIILNNSIDEGYFSSNRNNDINNDDIYHFLATVPLNIECTQSLSGVVRNMETKKTIANAKVAIVDNDGNELRSVKTNSRGAYKIDVPCDSNVMIVASKFEFENDEQRLETQNYPDEKLKMDLNLLPIVVCTQPVTGMVKNRNNAKPIADAIVAVVDDNEKILSTVMTDRNGRFSMDLLCNNTFKLIGGKEKFEDDSKMVTTKDSGDSEIEIELNLKPELDLTEVKIVRNKVIVNIDPIYFELNSSAINRDAAIELNKVVAIMNKYPELKIEGGSHTDSRGTGSYNLELSYKRASSTVEYIISKGIDPGRINARGYGETQLVNHCANGINCREELHAQNRRTEFVILNPDVLGYVEEEVIVKPKE